MNYMQYIPIICDAALILFFVAVIITMAKRGFIKSVYKLISVIITIIAVSFLTQPVSDILAESQAGAVIYRNINQSLVKSEQENMSDGDNKTLPDAENIWNMPSYIKNSAEIRSIKDDITSNASRTLTDMLLRLLTAICLFIIIRFIVMLLFNLIDIIFKLPLLAGINKIIGIFAGLINALAAVYIICAVISLNVGIFDGAKEVIENTYIVKYFYNYNILMNLFI